MKMIIKSLHLLDFKGVKDWTYVFDGLDMCVEGRNGSGKTTIMTAWLWLVADKDADMHSNPNIRPIGVEECIPRVEAVIDIDGRTVNIAKQQKMTVGKPNADGVGKVTLTNSYEINAVPKSERDFKAYLTELGVDFDLILPLSHTEVFTGQKSADMRKVLFNMVSSLTDADVVNAMPELTYVPGLIGNYSLEEIAAMQKATLRKITEEYGKEGEILRAKIEGLESGKVEIDVAAMELGKADATRRLSEIKAKIDDTTAMTSDYEKVSAEYFTLMNKRSDYADDYKNTHKTELSKVENRILEIKREISSLNRDKDAFFDTITRMERMRNNATEDADKSREEYRAIQREEFDENSAICPTCGREYPEEKKTALKAVFEAKKVGRLKDLETDGKAYLKTVTECEEVIGNAHKRIEEINAKLANLLNEEDLLVAKVPELRNFMPVEETEGYKEFTKDIDRLKSELDEMTTSQKSVVMKLREEETNITCELMGYEKALATNAANVNIDVQIDMLLKKQGQYEQNRADAEAILYELDMISKRKNELLTDEINSHFKLVKFVLFDYLKNGSYTDCCKVTLDGKILGESTNTGREVLAKLDIIDGLQKFYKESYPVFLDGAECLSEDTKNRIGNEAQLIMLSVSEGVLTVKER